MNARNGDFPRTIVQTITKAVHKDQSPCTAPCDGQILKMHYKWSVWVFLGCFFAIWMSWFHKDVIICASHHSADSQVRVDFLNICLSYIYVTEDGKNRFLLFYRWIHWVCLVLAALYYFPRKLSKNSENPKLKKLFEELAVSANKFDNTEHENLQKTVRFLNVNHKTHDGLFYKYVLCNIIALCIDIFTFFFLDFVFQGRFLTYGFDAYPFHRSPEDFADPMSRTFPPFAKCTINRNNKLMDERSEDFGCHLTVMELYEKLFLFVWFWLIALMTMTCAYIIFLFAYSFPYLRRKLLRVSKPVQATNTVTSVATSVASDCRVGDIYLLYRLRQFFSHARYFELLSKLGNPEVQQVSGISIDAPQPKRKQNVQRPKGKLKTQQPMGRPNIQQPVESPTIEQPIQQQALAPPVQEMIYQEGDISVRSRHPVAEAQV